MTFLPSVRLTKKAPKYLYLSLQYTDSHMSWHIQRWSKAPRSGWRFLGAFSFSWALQGCWCGGNVAMVGLHVCINSHRCPEFPSHDHYDAQCFLIIWSLQDSFKCLNFKRFIMRCVHVHWLWCKIRPDFIVLMIYSSLQSEISDIYWIPDQFRLTQHQFGFP